jgi:hypothetical protein
MQQTELMADWIRQHTLPDERIFIWGNEPNTYALSRRSPVGRYTVAFHIESFGAYDETMSAIEAYRPRFIIDAIHAPDSFERLYTHLSTEYALYEEVGSATVYRWLGR